MLSAPAIILLVFACLTPFVVLFGSIVYLLYFQAEEDKNRAWFAKIVVVITMTFAIISIFLIPFDVSNLRISQITGKNFFILTHLDPLVTVSDLEKGLGITFQVFYGMVFVFLIFILPFVIFFYETEDPEQPVTHQLKWATIYSILIAIFCIAIILVLFFIIGKANIPVTTVTSNVWRNSIDEARLVRCNNDKDCLITSNIISFNVQFIVYVIGLFNTFGWMVFLILGGCGMSTLPIELIKSFIYRPKRLRSDEFLIIKDQVMRKTEKMIELGTKIQEAKEEGRFNGRKNYLLLKDFKEATLALEDHWNTVQTSFYKGGGQIILPFIYLFLGVISCLISIIWLIQIISWLVIPQGYNFGMLNYVLYYSDFIFEFLPFIGSILYTFFTVYLIICVIAGSIKIAKTIPLFTVHPLQPHNTLMNSLLFNTGLFLIAAITVTQFSADAFSQYISSSVLDVMYNSVIKNLFILNYFYLVINYFFLGFVVLGVVLSFIFIKERTKDEKQLEQAIQKILQSTE